MAFTRYCNSSLKKRILAGEYIPWLERQRNVQYVRQLILSFPPWVGKQSFARILERRAQLKRMHAATYSIDHIIPLNHPYVCGLTVPENLQVIPEAVNNAKGNAWHWDQTPLFHGPEQPKLL